METKNPARANGVMAMANSDHGRGRIMRIADLEQLEMLFSGMSSQFD